jgi:excisionase family DNA binding protein
MSTSRPMAEHLAAIRRVTLRLCNEAKQLISNLPTSRCVQRLSPSWSYGISGGLKGCMMAGEDDHLRQQMRQLARAVREAESSRFYWSDDVARSSFQNLMVALNRVRGDWAGRETLPLPDGQVVLHINVPAEMAHLHELADAATALPIGSNGSAEGILEEENRAQADTPPREEDRRYITFAQAASLTALSKGYLSKLCSEGTLATNGVKGRGRRIDAASLAEFMALRERPKR